MKLSGTSLSNIDKIDKISYYLILIFLFSGNFSIALCYMVFSILLVTSCITYINNTENTRLPEFFKYLILFSILTLLSTLFSIDKLSSLKDNKELFIYLLIPVFIITIKNKKRFNNAIYTIFYSAVISSLIGIFISVKEGISLSHRLKGFSSHWMTYSGLLMLVFVFFTIYNTYEKNKAKKIINFSLLSLLLISILLSLTRSVWIGIFISIGGFFVYFFKKRPVILFAPVVILILSFLFLPGSIKSRVFSIFDINNVTNKDRLYMAYTAVEIVKDFPITGVGSDNVKKVYPKYRHKNATKNNPHLHNNFFQIAAERGLITLIVFISFFISLFSNLIKKIKGGSELEKRVSIGVFFLVVAFLVAGLFEYNFGDTEIKFILLFFISLPFLNIFQKNNV